MSSGTRLFLLLGCAVVLALEVPRTLSDLTNGWRGPYVRHSGILPDPRVGERDALDEERLARTAAPTPPVTRPHGRLDLARR